MDASSLLTFLLAAFASISLLLVIRRRLTVAPKRR